MKFIPGSIFQNNTTRHGKYLKRGVSYRLRNIKPNREDGTVLYIFDTSNGESEIKFLTIKEADNFLEGYKV